MPPKRGKRPAAEVWHAARLASASRNLFRSRAEMMFVKMLMKVPLVCGIFEKANMMILSALPMSSGVLSNEAHMLALSALPMNSHAFKVRSRGGAAIKPQEQDPKREMSCETKKWIESL